MFTCRHARRSLTTLAHPASTLVALIKTTTLCQVEGEWYGVTATHSENNQPVTCCVRAGGVQTDTHTHTHTHTHELENYNIDVVPLVLKKHLYEWICFLPLSPLGWRGIVVELAGGIWNLVNAITLRLPYAVTLYGCSLHKNLRGVRH